MPVHLDTYTDTMVLTRLSKVGNVNPLHYYLVFFWLISGVMSAFNCLCKETLVGWHAIRHLPHRPGVTERQGRPHGARAKKSNKVLHLLFLSTANHL